MPGENTSHSANAMIIGYLIASYKFKLTFLRRHKEYIACTHECLEMDPAGNVVSRHYTNGCYQRYFTRKVCIRRFSVSGQTATILSRREGLELDSQEAIDDYSRMDCTGDVRMTLIMALRGNIYHIHQIMSAYVRNTGSTTSWSGRMKDTNLHTFLF